MGGNGKFRRWKISIYKSSSSSKSQQKLDPPAEFLCPISGSLMSDPVVVSSGQTFERVAVQVCKDLGVIPNLSDGSTPDFSAVIPNLALKSSIINWCRQSRVEIPSPPDYSSMETTIVQAKTASQQEPSVSETELLRGVENNPPFLFSHAASDLNPRNNYSSSSEESVIANATPFLPFATRPACYSSPSSSAPSSSSSETVYDEALGTPDGIGTGIGMDEMFVTKFKSLDVMEQEEAVILLRKTTKANDEDARVRLCTPKLLQAIKPLLVSRYPIVQTNAVASIVNLSLANVNKVKIVRSGMVPILVDLLKGGFEESQAHAAGGIFSLALQDENKMAIGVLGALEPLLHALRSGTELTRRDSALALYHLSIVSSNRVKLIKLGAVGILLGMLRSGVLVGRVVLVVCNLAVSPEGRSALLDGGAVASLVAILRDRSDSDSSESTRENCVAALYSLSHGSLRFRGLAREARASEVLQAVVEHGSDRAREKANRILAVLRGRDGEEESGEIDWEAVMEGGLSRTRHRVPARYSSGLNSTEF
ncbi:U-box domain-containing protein 40-like [Coffea arabica]|uniref:RING-type E3 ubiquitin transferase n=1 Tax=Coffea arabica TaxID=13443 RepID=A0A6P6XGP9_COFAR|nr:U-box domain-containing protein 38-like [Coffea arabica]